MEEKVLVILAAGMGSRVGGMKQIEPVGPNGEFLIDYSIYSAIRYGFTKVVFIIKEENYGIFKETIGSRVEPHINVEYCFQKNDNLPEGYEVPADRVKPLGTAHAILCCKNNVHEPFMIINADDFYGRNGFEVLGKALSEMTGCNDYCMDCCGYRRPRDFPVVFSCNTLVSSIDFQFILFLPYFAPKNARIRPPAITDAI